MKRTALLAFLLTLSGLLNFGSHTGAVGTPAGTEITNQAQADFIPPTTGLPTVVTSNTVTTRVQAVCALSITPDGTLAQPARSVTVLPGERAVFAYTLVNAGNTPSTYPVSAQLVSGGTLAASLKVFQDLNNNGQLDATDPEVNSVTLNADASLNLLLVADTPNAQGEAYVNLVGSCAGGTQTDQNNISLVKVGPPPVLNVQKTFTPALVKPGTETTVTITATNSGQGQSREVILTDPLADQAAQGLTFVPGSAQASQGTLEYSQDGTTWVANEIQPVRGVRVRVPSLAPSATLTLTFRMLAGTSAEGKTIQNVATAQTGTQTNTGTASADVRYQPGIAIGPVGNPEAPEGTPADSQTVPFAAVGQAVCFDHTIRNTGNVTDLFRITVTYPQGAATATLYGADGQVLVQPLTLAPGQVVQIKVCYDPTQAGALDALLTIQGDRGTSNVTHDLVAQVESGLPTLTKTYAATTANDQGQPVLIPSGGTVAVNDTITYNLNIHNPYTHALTGVVVSDPVPAHLNFVSASAGGTLSGTAGAQVVTWNLGSLAAGETRTLSLVTLVTRRAIDGEALKNTFSMVTSELSSPLTSNTVETPVWTAKLAVHKAISKAEVTYGDRVTYTLTITNQSATTAILNADVTDTPDNALQYLTGSSKLDGQALSDPLMTGGQLHWKIAQIPAGGVMVITYDMRVLAQASGDLLNEVKVVGTGAGTQAKAIASNRATATAKLKPLGFAPQSDIIGVVFVDRNRNGLYDPGLDTPVPGARVLLAGGRQVVTDPAGRYNFANVTNGTWALRLDPNTTPYPPLHVVQDGGLSGTQTVNVKGLTSVDFPLAPLGGDISALRRTILIMGDVRVEKAVYAVQGGYVVTLKITTPTPLSGVNLTDPLPSGAALKEGRNTFTGNLAAGETNLTYHFDWNGPSNAATTDPVLSWRY